MEQGKTRLSRTEQRKRFIDKARQLRSDKAEGALSEDAVLDAMVKESIKDHGA